MRKINQIVVHCSATRCDRPYTEADLTADHLQRGFSEAGIIIMYERRHQKPSSCDETGSACERLCGKYRHLL